MKNVYFIKETVERSNGFDAWDVEIAGIHILNTQELKEYVSKHRIINVTFLHKAEEEKSKKEKEDILLFLKDSVTDKPLKIHSITRCPDDYHDKMNYIVRVEQSIDLYSSIPEADKKQPIKKVIPNSYLTEIKDTLKSQKACDFHLYCDKNQWVHINDELKTNGIYSFYITYDNNCLWFSASYDKAALTKHELDR